jgi:uncharacterized membrane protein (DUF4010 family)
MENFLIDTQYFQLTLNEFFIRLLVAVGIGTIIGMQREHAAIHENSPNFAGIRTFILVVLLGFIAGLTYYLLSPLIYFGILIAAAIVTGISYWITAAKGDIGATTEFTALIGFVLGTLSFLGFIEVSLMITTLVMVILSAKIKLHDLVGKITKEELYDFIRFVVLALLIFPFLPDENLGPYEVLNPREIGWVVLLTSGLGLIGYVLMKFFGSKKGILLSGIIGGLVSSTAVTWVFAKKSKQNPALSHSCATAILAASSIMILRVLIWTFIFNKSLFNELFIGISLIFLAAIGATLLIFFTSGDKEITSSEIPKGKPLDLVGAFVFGLIYTMILLIISYADENLGESGILISSALAGLSDIDAITISVSKLAEIRLDLATASSAILIGTISNTLLKMGIGVWAGSPMLRKDLFLGYGIIFLAATSTFIFI